MTDGWEVLLMLGFGLGGIALTVFWIWMLVDCVTAEPIESRVLWVLLIVFLGWFGALIYYFGRRPDRLDVTFRANEKVRKTRKASSLP
jgi:hypothetical protein